jgi:hypothetical protein
LVIFRLKPEATHLDDCALHSWLPPLGGTFCVLIFRLKPEATHESKRSSG